MQSTSNANNSTGNTFKTKTINVDATKIDNAVLKRLIGEIDFERRNEINAYNRTHNRHNRGR